MNIFEKMGFNKKEKAVNTKEEVKTKNVLDEFDDDATFTRKNIAGENLYVISQENTEGNSFYNPKTGKLEDVTIDTETLEKELRAQKADKRVEQKIKERIKEEHPEDLELAA